MSKKKFGLGVVVAVCMLGLCAPSFAEDDQEIKETVSPWGKTTGNVGLTSDYVIRGQSQTEHRPAIQGGLDWNNPWGFYLGAWGSNVRFPDVPSTAVEVDWYGGYTFAISTELSVSGGLYYYSYYQGASGNTWDFPVRLNWKAFKVGLNYSPRWGGQDGHVWYPNIAWADKVIWDVTLGVTVGYSIAAASLGFNDYADFRIDLSREVLGLTAQLSGVFVDKRQFGGADDPRLIVAVSKEF